MGTNYFIPENSWRHLFFVTGLTADEFYTDGGLKLNIEQLTYMELKKSGYERIVFYDKDNKLYCYDDESYSLLRVNGSNRKTRGNSEIKEKGVPVRQNRGLRRGRHAQTASTSATSGNVETSTAQVAAISKEENTLWVAGDESKILIKAAGKGPLHLGMRDNTFIKRQIDAYMYDALIKTAVVINDPTSFLREFGEDPMHSVTVGYERMGSNNQNILVFLYTDEALGNIYRVDQLNVDNKSVNQIHIACPNASELKNMLMYFRVNRGLRFKMKDLHEISLNLRQAMALSPETIRIKEVYTRLEKYGTEKEFTVDSCFELLDVKKPIPAEVQLNSLIGMSSVKKVLTSYNTNDNPHSSIFEYITASRLQPDKEMPKRPDEMLHFVLTGNPGTGKTTVAELIGQLFYEMGYLEHGHVVQADRSQLVAGYVGQTAGLVQRQVEAAMGGVLFIDEAYSLKRQRDTGNDFGQEAIDTLCKLMDQYKGKFIVVAAGYPKEMEVFLNSNPGLSSRFKELHIEDYSSDEMSQILRFHVNKNEAVLSDTLLEKLPDFCENWVNLAGENWGNAREAVNLVNNMTRAWKNDPEKQTVLQEDGKEYCVLEIRHLPEQFRDYLKPVAEMRSETLNRLNQMTGLKEVKATVETLRRRMLSGDMTEPGHYLFTGNPGTGKTTVARYMGQILRNLEMLKRGHVKEYTASGLMSEVFSDKNQGDFNALANEAIDGVLFIDEAYQLQTDTTGRGRPILDALLPFMENNRKNICVIVAGYDDEMEDFLDTNPGYKSRFTDTIHFENYTGTELHEILLQMLEEKGIVPDDNYREYSLRALSRYVDIHGKEKDFGNARFVRTVFLTDSLDTQTDRLIKQYGEDFSRDLKQNLTGEDIPAEFIRFTKTPLDRPDTRSALEKLDSLIGYESIKKELRKLLKTAQFNKTNPNGVIGMTERLHWVLEGNPGTGKTTIANLIGQVYKECGILQNGRTIKVTRSDLIGTHVGESEEKTRRCIEKAMGGVLFIDEAYSLTQSEGDPYGKAVITEIVEAMETLNGEFAVVCAGYPDNMEDFLKANSGLVSRMKKFILEDYTSGELVRIFQLKCQHEKTIIDEELLSKLEVFFDNKKRVESKLHAWGNGREVENLLREMLHLWMDNPSYIDDSQGVERRLLKVEHIPEDQKRFLKDKKATNKKESSAIDDINNLIGFDEVKTKLSDLLALKKTATEHGREDLLEDINLHWVLRGNPGTGKTTVAELIGKVYKEMGLLSHGRTVKVTRSDLVAGYVGQTAIKTQKCIDRAMGGILFIDEAYSLKRAGASGDDFGQEAIDTLLEQMSARNGEFAVIVAGYPKEMEVFLGSNPGFESRFDDDFLLEDYSADELLRIFTVKCKKKKFYLDEETSLQIKQLFENMIATKIRNWANGREAENLEKRMRNLWARNPISRIDETTGEMRSFYTIDHIPDRYKAYLSNTESEDNVETAKEPTEEVGDSKFSLPSDKLTPIKKDYNYDDVYLSQVKSVVFISTKTSEGVSSGSGSIITDDGYILTCRHVIAGNSDIHVRLKLERDGIKETQWEKAVVVWENQELDAAILKIAKGDYPSLSIRPLDIDTKTGEAIYLWGYPFGGRLSDDLNELQPSLFQGYISSIQTKNGLERINTNMEAKRGCSGGPVFSKKDGSIVGILCGSQTVGDEGFIEEINYVLPVRYILEKVFNLKKSK